MIKLLLESGKTRLLELMSSLGTNARKPDNRRWTEDCSRLDGKTWS